MRLIAALILTGLMVPPVAAQHRGYAGEQRREIKALSAQETADLLAGRGMGLARAAELNQHPGPMHVLELREPLGLTPDQVTAVQASFARMQAAARLLGAALVDRERELDEAFRAGSVTPARVAMLTDAIGALQGRVRATHLAAHIEMRNTLTSQQVAAYDQLRGYGDRAPPQQHRMHPG